MSHSNSAVKIHKNEIDDFSRLTTTNMSRSVKKTPKFVPKLVIFTHRSNVINQIEMK